MMAKMIDGMTRILGKAQGFLGLPVRDEVVEHAGERYAVMVTAWEPTPAELEALNSGAFVEITMFGVGHPPILVGVGSHQRGRLAAGEGWKPSR